MGAPTREKRCRVCGESYLPLRSLQRACSVPCAIQHATTKRKAEQEKQYRRVLHKRKEAVKTKAQWTKEAQASFNRYIRERDHFRPCASCGDPQAGQYHAGHYRTTKAASQLRFNLFNCHRQCAQCNNHKSGNITEYRIELVKRIGLERVTALEENSDTACYTIEYLKRVKRIFNARARLYRKHREATENYLPWA